MFAPALRGLAALAALATAACAGNAGGRCTLQPAARLPIAMHRNIPVVPATVDGAPARLILDTGAEHTVLLAPFADRIGLKRDPRNALMIRGIGSAIPTALARPGQIELGDVTVRRPSVIVSAFSTGDLPGELPDGLLGADILARFDVDIDVPQGALTFYPAACQQDAPPWDKPYAALGGRLFRGRFFVPLALDGVTIPVAVDTGAEYSLVSTRAALAAGVQPATLGRDPPTQLAVVGPDRVTARVHRFDKLRLGPETYTSPVLPVAALPYGMMEGLLGMNYLRHHRVWLSYRSGRVFVAQASL